MEKILYFILFITVIIYLFKSIKWSTFGSNCSKEWKEKAKETNDKLRNIATELEAEVKSKSEKIDELNKKIEDSSSELQNLRVEQERVKFLQEALDKKDEVVENIKNEMTKEFKNLSNELLESKQKSLQDVNREQIKLLLEPFDKELKGFKEHINKLNSEQNQSVALLRGELIQIKEFSSSLSKEAKSLTKALKGDNKVQGNWGELILERALESYGLREGKEFKREQTYQDEDRKLRTDVTLFLPDNKHIIIDAKVSLNSYSDILKATTKEEEQRAKNAHIISVKRHIDNLASKQYHMIDTLKAPEFTLMFMPIEAAYLMALDSDNLLYEYAFERNIAVVTPTTLLTTLKTVATLWKLANHDKNMVKLSKEAASLHDKFALFLEEFNQVEFRLQQALISYDKAKNRLHSGHGSLHSKIKSIGELSGKSKKSLPATEEN